MIYLYIEKDRIKALYFKKSLLGQFDINYYQKQFQLSLLDNGKVINTDVLASAVKEIITNLIPPSTKEKDLTCILPQAAFEFIRTEIPADIAPSAVDSFIKDKINSSLQVDLDDYVYDCFYVSNEKQKQVNLYALNKNTLTQYQEVMKLLDLKIISVIPDSLAFYKLFEKTLRKDKKEYILYSSYENSQITGYLFDTYGLVDKNQLQLTINDKTQLETILKQKAVEYENAGRKINRLILSGETSEEIRQDTFTKNTGMWTNPLKKIIANFYQDYLKTLITPHTKPLSILTYDGCFGAFIFTHENRNFSLLKSNFHLSSPTRKPLSQGFAFKKEYLIFIVSFFASFIFFLLISRLNLNFDKLFTPPKLPSINKTVTPTLTPPSPTPAPSLNKEAINIKVLNGGGVSGKATEVKEILNDAGYPEVLTGNADNFDYEQTVIQVKKSKIGANTMIKEDLKDYTTSIKEEPLDEEETADVIVIIGQDFK